jgi:hypothetical protein
MGHGSRVMGHGSGLQPLKLEAHVLQTPFLLTDEHLTGCSRSHTGFLETQETSSGTVFSSIKLFWGDG